MVIGLTGALIAGALASVIGTGANMAYNAIEANKQRSFEAEQAEIDRNFQQEMRDTSLKSQVDQANELGISPSLVLGTGSNSLGGAMAHGASASSQNNAFGNTTNELIKYINQDRYLDTLEKIEDKKADMKMLQMNNSVNGKKPYMDRNYTEEDYKNMFDDINDIKI